MEAVQTKFTNLQLELLKIFSRNVNERQLLDIRDILTQYFARQVTDEMDKLWDEKGWTNDTMNQWLDERMRTPYKDEIS